MYNNIFNPLTNKKINLFSNEGKYILKKYITFFYNIGGVASVEPNCSCEKCLNIKEGTKNNGEKCECNCDCKSMLCSPRNIIPFKCEGICKQKRNLPWL